MKLVILTYTLVVCVASLAWAQEIPETDELQRQARELAQKRQELLDKKIGT